MKFARNNVQNLNYLKFLSDSTGKIGSFVGIYGRNFQKFFLSLIFTLFTLFLKIPFCLHFSSKLTYFDF